MSKIFLSYRRSDTQYAAYQIRERLAARFGKTEVVLDIDNIPPGADFPTYIRESVTKCDILLALIGSDWLHEITKRRDDPKDWVRIEIAEGLKQNKVIPVLIGGALMPTESELPPELVSLPNKMASEVRGGRDLDFHLDRIVSDVERYFGARETRSATSRHEASPKPNQVKLVKLEIPLTGPAKELWMAVGYVLVASVGGWVIGGMVLSLWGERGAGLTAAITSLLIFGLGFWLTKEGHLTIGVRELGFYRLGMAGAIIWQFIMVLCFLYLLVEWS